MALSRKLDPSGLVVTRATGVLTAEDLTAKAPSLAPELVDLREIDDFDVTADAIRELAQRAIRNAERLRPGRMAFLVSSDAVFGMCRMFQALVDGSALEVRVFRDPPEAYAWLGISAAGK